MDFGRIPRRINQSLLTNSSETPIETVGLSSPFHDVLRTTLLSTVMAVSYTCHRLLFRSRILLQSHFSIPNNSYLFFLFRSLNLMAVLDSEAILALRSTKKSTTE
ncbi:hypothetical protein U1Q18_020566 [Sarracenia purpurea var. burkii]